MKNLFNLSKILIGLFVLNTIFTLKVQAFGEIQISEINYQGYTVWEDSTTPKSSDEFIEIYNNTDNSINLTDYKLRVLSGNSDKIITLSGIIEAKDYLIIRKVTQSQKNTLIPLEKVIFSSDFNLSNTVGAFIELRDNNNITVDSVNFFGKWPVVTENGYSLHRLENNIWESKKISLLQKEYKEPIVEEEIIEEEEIPTETGEEETSEGVILNYDNKLKISEFLPDQGTKFESEFIEIENLTSEDIDLTGWKVDDLISGGGSAKSLSGNIPGFGFYSIRVSMLNNYNSNAESYEEVNLIDPNGKIQDKQIYFLKDVKKENSLALINGKFEWTNQVTANLSNKQSLIIEEPKEEILTEDKNEIEEEEEVNANTQIVEAGWIYFTEFLADPKSGTENEFIEIYNSTNQIIKLDGWKLGDRVKTITLSGEIKPYSYRIFRNVDTKITLNNTGETVRLSSPDGNIYQEVEIPKSLVDQSYSKFEDRWLFTTTITEGKDNILTEPAIIETKQAKSKTSASKTKSTQEKEDSSVIYRTINFGEISNLNHNDNIEITGIVFINLDKIYKNSFYITDGRNILRVTIPNNSDYNIDLNQNLTLQGSIHKTKTQMYLKLKDIAGVESKNFTPKFEMQDTLSRENAFVQISGILNTNTATKLVILSDNQKENIVKISENAFRKPEMRKGDTVLIQGFVEEYDGELRLVPYDDKHISVETEQDTSTEKTTKSNNIVQASSVDNTDSNNLVSRYVPWDEYATENQELLQDSNFAQWLDKFTKSIFDSIPKELRENKIFSLIFLINIIWWIFSSINFKKN